MTRALIVAAVVALASAACAAQPTTGPSVASADVRVGLTEWDVATSATAVSPGPVRLTVTNAGATAHDLRIAGAADGAVPLLAPGERRTVTLKAVADGVLTLWCDLPGHRAQGMELEIPVTADGDEEGPACPNDYDLSIRS